MSEYGASGRSLCRKWKLEPIECRCQVAVGVLHPLHHSAFPSLTSGFVLWKLRELQVQTLRILLLWDAGQLLYPLWVSCDEILFKWVSEKAREGQESVCIREVSDWPGGAVHSFCQHWDCPPERLKTWVPGFIQVVTPPLSSTAYLITGKWNILSDNKLSLLKNENKNTYLIELLGELNIFLQGDCHPRAQ